MKVDNLGGRHASAYLGRVLGDGNAAVGTCFQLSSGVLVTAWHVLADIGSNGEGSEVWVDGLEGGEAFVATVRSFDEAHDLAVLHTAGDLGGSIRGLAATDTVGWEASVIVTGVAEVDDPGIGYRLLDAPGIWVGRTVRDDGVRLGRLRSTDVVPGMSGAPVRLADDDTVVVGVVSARYNSSDGWLAGSVWVARTERLETLVGDLNLVKPQPGLQGTPTVALFSEEQMALGLILSDPRAVDRGAWLYPLHQQLTYRGLADAGSTLTLGRLVSLGLIEYVDAPSKDSLTGDVGTAPAYRVTALGLNVAGSYGSIMNFREKYSYVVRLKGDEQTNRNFLERVKSLPAVEGQTRFIVEDAEGVSRIAVWSYEPLGEDKLASIAIDAKSVILDITRM
jgi:hypothetical protein